MCKPDSISPCSISNYTCDPLACPHGTYLDRNGCPSCECLPDPKEVLSCSENRESQGITIEFNNDYVTFPKCSENNPREYKPKMCNEKE